MSSDFDVGPDVKGRVLAEAVRRGGRIRRRRRIAGIILAGAVVLSVGVVGQVWLPGSPHHGRVVNVGPGIPASATTATAAGATTSNAAPTSTAPTSGSSPAPTATSLAHPTVPPPVPHPTTTRPPHPTTTSTTVPPVLHLTYADIGKSLSVTPGTTIIVTLTPNPQPWQSIYTLYGDTSALVLVRSSVDAGGTATAEYRASRATDREEVIALHPCTAPPGGCTVPISFWVLLTIS